MQCLSPSSESGAQSEDFEPVGLLDRLIWVRCDPKGFILVGTILLHHGRDVPHGPWTDRFRCHTNLESCGR